MGKTKIEWTDATWNPLRGCTRVSEGCRNCYAERVAARFSGPSQPYEGLATMTEHGPRWTGKIRLVHEHLEDPLRWREPRMIFVNSMSDLFHEDVPDRFIDRVFNVMALAQRHTFQVLTKRPDRMAEYTQSRAELEGHNSFCLSKWSLSHYPRPHTWPLPNVWLGTSVENQETADKRIPYLLQTPATVRFLSCEPLLGMVDLSKWLLPYHCARCDAAILDRACPVCGSEGHRRDRIHLAIVGGESGPGARPMHPDGVRSLRDQCQAAGVPFFFKQWGEWAPIPNHFVGPQDIGLSLRGDQSDYVSIHDTTGVTMRRIGKKAAGAFLDGREWKEMPGDHIIGR